MCLDDMGDPKKFLPKPAPCPPNLSAADGEENGKTEDSCIAEEHEETSGGMQGPNLRAGHANKHSRTYESGIVAGHEKTDG